MRKLVKLSFIRGFNATDVTDIGGEKINAMIKGKHVQVHYVFAGTYGASGCVFTIDDEWYKITARSSSLFCVI